MIYRLLRPLIVVSLALMVLSGLSRVRAEAVFDVLVIDTQVGPVSFDIEIARTDEERQRGLMARAYMPERRGMLFDFEEPQIVRMWMKDTPLPLDMIFIRADGTIARIISGEPFSTRTLPSGEPVLAVLEINGGTSARFNIKSGDVVRYKLFGTTK